MRYRSPEALRQAKANIEKWYPVVGVLDIPRTTLRVMESIYPKYFENVSDIYYQQSAGKFQ